MTKHITQKRVDAKQPFSLTSAAFFENPYPFYDHLRSIGPLYKGSLLKNRGWYVTGYEEALAILKDTRFQNRIPLPQTTKKYEFLKNIQNNMMVYKNQPDHKRLRFLVSKAFTPKMAEKYRPCIVETANDLLNGVQNKMDVVSDFAFPLASLVIAKILGVPAEDRYLFREWSIILLQTIDFTRSRKELHKGNDKIIKLIDYFRVLIKKRKQNPRNDLISMLIKEEDKVSEEELLSTCILLLIAGHETTVNLISNSIFALINHPDQFRKLKENPSLTERAVEEFLRFESPTQMIARYASEDIEINKNIIEKGEQVYILLGAVNRDPQKFIAPNRLDITRKSNYHLAFGHGVHFCLGASLARMEAQMAIHTLMHRITDLQLDAAELQWRNLMGFRSLEKLPITFQNMESC
ncbi:cytochrome P450 [Alteribacillus bidgolensis]|uniref:Pimelate synthase BioI n=1 Tax=Alteribacillus bidgolensis TaxID=930129 RepID=A0A1G8H1K7_9BACI|nr:cytochrome P450 [Alteribacillus bidgolensis]SDI00390.1 pimelate synthase BioI [Alteribacillus bidgolensis]